jgi:hypothetical protein
MLAFACEQYRTDAIRQRCEEVLDADDGLIVERVALLRPVETQNTDRSLPLSNERGRKANCKPLCHYSTS